MDGSERPAEQSEGRANLEVNPDDVCQLIQLARDFHAQDSVIFDDEPESLTDDLVFDVLEQHGEDPIVAEFRNILADLDRDQQVQVVLLMWLGRGDYDTNEWKEARGDAEEQWTDFTADYLLAHPLVAEYLEDGLELLGFHCE